MDLVMAGLSSASSSCMRQAGKEYCESDGCEREGCAHIRNKLGNILWFCSFRQYSMPQERDWVLWKGIP